MTTDEETSKTRVNSHRQHSSDLGKTHLQLQRITTSAAKKNDIEIVTLNMISAEHIHCVWSRWTSEKLICAFWFDREEGVRLTLCFIDCPDVWRWGGGVGLGLSLSQHRDSFRLHDHRVLGDGSGMQRDTSQQYRLTSSSSPPSVRQSVADAGSLWITWGSTCGGEVLSDDRVRESSSCLDSCGLDLM